MEQDASSLHTAFALAAQGTRAEGATLDIIPFSCEAWCARCKSEVSAIGADGVCATCGDPLLTGRAAPELVVHEVVVEE
jgi:hydrogenase nickel incorporation protein HypA/HybF